MIHILAYASRTAAKRSPYLVIDQDVLHAQGESIQLEEGSEETSQTRQQLACHLPAVQLVAKLS